MDDTVQAIMAKVQGCMEIVRRLYPTAYLCAPSVGFNLKGKVAGRANSFSVTFNLEMAKANNLFIDDIVPHEVAHTVHRQLISQGFTRDSKPHGHTWKLICIQLGGNGARSHNMLAPNTRNRQLFTYNVAGCKFQVGLHVHRKIQAGYMYTVKGNRGYVHANDYAAPVSPE